VTAIAIKQKKEGAGHPSRKRKRGFESRRYCSVAQLAERVTLDHQVQGSSPCWATKMIDLLVQSFYVYYGLDWLSFFFGVGGMYLISEKNKVGFLLQAVSVICAIGCSVIAGQFGFIVSNAVMFCVVSYGYWNWDDNAP
jgi:hypothetical protein